MTRMTRIMALTGLLLALAAAAPDDGAHDAPRNDAAGHDSAAGHDAAPDSLSVVAAAHGTGLRSLPRAVRLPQSAALCRRGAASGPAGRGEDVFRRDEDGGA